MATAVRLLRAGIVVVGSALLYRRQADASWALFEASGLDGAIELGSIGYTLRLRELYAAVIAEGEAGQR
jgi:hypothetical protein